MMIIFLNLFSLNLYVTCCYTDTERLTSMANERAFLVDLKPDFDTVDLSSVVTVVHDHSNYSTDQLMTMSLSHSEHQATLQSCCGVGDAATHPG